MCSGCVHRPPGTPLRECPPACGLLLYFAAGSTRYPVHETRCRCAADEPRAPNRSRRWGALRSEIKKRSPKGGGHSRSKAPRRRDRAPNGNAAKTLERSSQPPLAALVALDVAEALAIRAADTEIELLHVLVLAQALRLAVHDDAAVLQDVAIGGVAQRHVGVLLGQKEGDFFLAVEVFDDVEHLVHDLRCQAHGRLVEQHHGRVGHQRTSDGAHLLFAAGGIAGLRVAARLQAREVRVHLLQRLLHRGLAVGARVGAGHQVLLDRQVGEAVAAFHHLDQPALDQLGRESASMRSPRSSMVPLVTAPRSPASRLLTARSVVVLPAPLPPSSATMPPSGTSATRP
ncbi:hypothetical protein DdX_22163 [Ditylenchus destructor]|uniref:Uncharacterized protein n=1 Tax=Ditylenchus destructor TaxID=166010 RepID=A0AAD4MDZ2_9BILA|nr:hypothetical protein DdX_22163 [Ditylenchus destructor]